MEDSSLARAVIGIIGVGMVGGALERWFRGQGRTVRCYDRYKEIGSLELVNGADVVFLALPTPFDEASQRFDSRAIEEAVSRLRSGKVIVIKSTVLPGTTEALQARYPAQRFLFSPEFLTERTADEDMARPKVNLVGYTDVSRELAPHILRLFASAPFERIMSSRAAELYKYLRNAFFATKVVFFNQLYDLCEAIGVDYEALRECAAQDPWVAPGGQHTVIWHKGYRGYGGRCLPKDVRAFIQFAREHGVDLKLLKAVEAANASLTAIPARPAGPPAGRAGEPPRADEHGAAATVTARSAGGAGRRSSR